jgi:hypothetical protein
VIISEAPLVIPSGSLCANRREGVRSQKASTPASNRKPYSILHGGTDAEKERDRRVRSLSLQ